MFSNSRWPDHFMDMGEVSGAGVTGGFPNDDAHKFNIWVVLTPTGGGLSVLLVSKKWPEYSVAVGAKWSDDSSTRMVDSEHITDDDVGIMEASVQLVIPPVARPDPQNSESSSYVMIQGAENANWFNVATTSWEVHAPDKDEGAGSYWYVHPALPSEILSKMQAYTGRPCELNCGEPEAAALEAADFAGSRLRLGLAPMLLSLVAAVLA